MGELIRFFGELIGFEGIGKVVTSLAMGNEEISRIIEEYILEIIGRQK